MKKGFTIVELLMVVGVIAILAGIVTTAASAAMRTARGRRADAMKQVLQAGLNAYYAQKGEWPGSKLQSLADNGATDKDKQVYDLTNSEATETFRELVQKSVQAGSNPFLDPSGLFVATEAVASLGDDTKNARGGHGRDFRTCFTKGKHNSTMSISEMVFGYADARTGFFRRYKIKYNVRTDSATVYKQTDE